VGVREALIAHYRVAVFDLLRAAQPGCAGVFGPRR